MKMKWVLMFAIAITVIIAEGVVIYFQQQTKKFDQKEFESFKKEIRKDNSKVVNKKELEIFP